LPGESNPGQERASGVSCTAGLGCTWERGAGRRAASDSRRGGLKSPTDCGVEREQPELRRWHSISQARRPPALGLWVRRQPAARNLLRGQDGRSLHDHLSGTRTSTCQPNAELSAAPLAGVEGEPGVGWLSPEQTARRRPTGCGKNVSTQRGDRSLRVKQTQVPTAPAVSAAQRGWGAGWIYNIM
jgi:hypothetical protein